MKKIENYPIKKISPESLKCVGYLSNVENGTLLTYDEIEVKTGVKMDYKGRQIVRRALRKLKREYENKANVGIVLASEANANKIITHKLED